jgi:ABC-type sugar transport system ATPase subunit
MNGGRAEQIGAPMEVYENPATQFVAGFIGSPAMNFLPGKTDGAGRVALDGGGTVRAAGGAIAAGGAVTVGIRPEHLVPCTAAEATLAGTVEMVEQLGADSLLHVAHGGATLVARVAHGAQPTVGATLHLGADPAHIYLFAADTGARLR